MSKGDNPRPFAVDKDTYTKNWERTFAKPPELPETSSVATLELRKQIAVIEKKMDELQQQMKND